MSHKERHRGPNLKDAGLFTQLKIPVLRDALDDFCWLLSKGYSGNSSLKLVGDRFELVQRQRLLMMRAGCSNEQAMARAAKSVADHQVAGRDVYIDGLNLLITIESALSGGYVFVCRDGALRDMSSIHGTYRRVQETQFAIELIGNAFSDLKMGRVHWLLDKPVSNSGRLKTNLREIAEANEWDWEVELCQSPDYELKQTNKLTITTDAVILDEVGGWFNLSRFLIETQIPDAKLIDLNRPE